MTQRILVTVVHLRGHGKTDNENIQWKSIAERQKTIRRKTDGHETIQTLTAHCSLSGDTTIVGDLFGRYYDYYYYNDKNNVIIVISIGGRRHWRYQCNEFLASLVAITVRDRPSWCISTSFLHWNEMPMDERRLLQFVYEVTRRTRYGRRWYESLGNLLVKIRFKL